MSSRFPRPSTTTISSFILQRLLAPILIAAALTVRSANQINTVDRFIPTSGCASHLLCRARFTRPLLGLLLCLGQCAFVDCSFDSNQLSSSLLFVVPGTLLFLYFKLVDPNGWIDEIWLSPSTNFPYIASTLLTGPLPCLYDNDFCSPSTKQRAVQASKLCI
jgi:hypothetical protein